MTARGTVFLIDDDADIRGVVQEIRTDAGYEVLTAADGGEALGLLPSLPRPCVVLLDWMMPGVAGGEFLARAQESGALAGIPVLLFTASRLPCVPAGVAGVIRKPIALDALLALIGEHFQG
jgi:CheY-like chemotaxis protein